MQYICLIYSNETSESAAPDDEQRTVMDEYNAFTKAVRDAGVLVGGEAFHPTSEARTVQVADGRPTVTTGPAVRTDIQLGGMYILDAPDIEKAAEWAAKIPGAKWGKVEVRPLVDFSAAG